MNQKREAFLKSITYRIICIISLLAVTFLLTRNINQSIFITVIFQTIQTVLYYIHERIWAYYLPLKKIKAFIFSVPVLGHTAPMLYFGIFYGRKNP
ncbi:DUF2061 domain-containing protein [bacterium]|nr:DUF2061 domain-containing protein [bacterium]